MFDENNKVFDVMKKTNFAHLFALNICEYNYEIIANIAIIFSE